MKLQDILVAENFSNLSLAEFWKKCEKRTWRSKMSLGDIDGIKSSSECARLFAAKLISISGRPNEVNVEEGRNNYYFYSRKSMKIVFLDQKTVSCYKGIH